MVWGASRILPIRLDSVSITEEAFDPDLNPVRASADLSLQVLTYNDLPANDLGYTLFLRHQLLKETLATAAGGRQAAVF